MIESLYLYLTKLVKEQPMRLSALGLAKQC